MADRCRLATYFCPPDPDITPANAANYLIRTNKPMPDRLSVAIIGGGCSGALAALHLLRGQRPVRIHLVEPRAIAGLGLAYSTDCQQHLLNVPARCMSVLPSTPHDF